MMPVESTRLELLSALARKVLWLSSWTIHHANHVRPNSDGLKVGGHQASSASLVTIMSALYFSVLKPEDRLAVKPHASPVFHAIQYLFGHQTREKLENFRGFKGAQSYPSRTKDVDDVDFSTGSVGLGVAQTLFSSIVQDYVKAKGWAKDRREGRMIALVGDAELDEGNIFEPLGWDVVVLKYGALLEAAFKEPGGERLRGWIDRCPNQLYSALTFQGGAAWRKRLEDELGDQGDLTRLIAKRSDPELAALMTNLAGHDGPSLLKAFADAARHDRPTCFIAYTIKGFGLPLAGHKDNHSGLMTPAQMETFRTGMNVREGHEWEKFEGLTASPEILQAY